MSCFMMNPNTTAAIADYINTLYHFGYDFLGYSIPESLVNALEINQNTRTKDIFNKLYALNAAAVNDRYSSHDEPEEIEMPKQYPALYHPKEATTQPWEYQLLKTIACYNYQTDEDATYKTDLHKAMQDLETAIMTHIVWNTPEMNAAKWG